MNAPKAGTKQWSRSKALDHARRVTEAAKEIDRERGQLRAGVAMTLRKLGNAKRLPWPLHRWAVLVLKTEDRDRYRDALKPSETQDNRKGEL